MILVSGDHLSPIVVGNPVDITELQCQYDQLLRVPTLPYTASAPVKIILRPPTYSNLKIVMSLKVNQSKQQ